WWFVGINPNEVPTQQHIMLRWFQPKSNWNKAII
ncbi:hypothetical protein ACUXFG_002399, partial [Staphylococcus capitis]